MVSSMMIFGPVTAIQFFVTGGVKAYMRRARDFAGTPGLPLLGQYLSQGRINVIASTFCNVWQ